MQEEQKHEAVVFSESNDAPKQSMKKRIALPRFFTPPIILVSIFLAILFLVFLFGLSRNIVQDAVSPQAPTITPTPSPIPFTLYKNPRLEKSDEFKIFLVGDSMTHALGPRGGIFNEELSNAHKGIFLQIFNYSQANQSIETLPQRLNESVQADTDLLLPPMLEGEPDLIILESFGYNPLSQHGLEGGLKRQTELLTEIMTTLTNKFPNTVIMFLSTIAPDRDLYGKNIQLTDRVTQANERIAYIENHNKYAQEHNIPLINVFQESLDAEGDGAEVYISPDDTIHPSNAGSELISKVMTRRILEENVFPQLE